MKAIQIVFVAMLAFMVGCISTPKPAPVSPGVVPLPSPETIPGLPYLVLSNNIRYLSAKEVKDKIKEHSGNYYLAEDSLYFIPTKQNMDVIVPYLDAVFRQFGVHYVAEATDCDDYARLKTELAQLILGQAYGVEASPTVFVIFVRQNFTWANVMAGGGHAVCVYACVNEEKNNEVEVYVWEPQSTQVVNVIDYPNKDAIFYVGKGLEAIASKKLEKSEN